MKKFVAAVALTIAALTGVATPASATPTEISAVLGDPWFCVAVPPHLICVGPP